MRHLLQYYPQSWWEITWSKSSIDKLSFLPCLLAKYMFLIFLMFYILKSLVLNKKEVCSCLLYGNLQNNLYLP